MSEESTSSPPYPPDNVTVSGMYRYIVALRAWAIEQQRDLVDAVPPNYRDRIEDEPGLPPDESVWANVSVVDHFFALRYVQGIRKGWDVTIREHEDTWNSKLALRKRFSLLLSALNILREAFVGPEEREMKTQQQRAAESRRRRALERRLRSLVDEEADADQGDGDTDPDVGVDEIGDDWFHDNT